MFWPYGALSPTRQKQKQTNNNNKNYWNFDSDGPMSNRLSTVWLITDLLTTSSPGWENPGNGVDLLINIFSNCRGLSSSSTKRRQGKSLEYQQLKRGQLNKLTKDDVNAVAD